MSTPSVDDVVGFVRTLCVNENTPAWYYILTRVGTDDPVYVEYTTRGDCPCKDTPAPFSPERLLELALKFHEQFIQGSRAIYQENSLEEQFQQYLASKTQALKDEAAAVADTAVVPDTVPESKALAEPVPAESAPVATSEATNATNTSDAKSDAEATRASARETLRKSLEVLQRTIDTHASLTAPRVHLHERRLDNLRATLTRDLKDALSSTKTPHGQRKTIEAALRHVHLEQPFGL